ncbi:GIY-YIG nuclease family protein [Isoalcanivorax pacificus]|uniref:GIY-YIG nuclease family protein n=1 Tax=Isoalcanivorax pacificus TaxID=1306787 RepID=UPI0009E1DDDA
MYEAESKAGYVYVLYDSSNPRLLKIGRTKRHPHTRKRELEIHHKIKWIIYAIHWFHDCEKAERVIHKLIRSSGCVYRSELYNYDAALANQVILSINQAMESTNLVPRR